MPSSLSRFSAKELHNDYEEGSYGYGDVLQLVSIELDSTKRSSLGESS